MGISSLSVLYGNIGVKKREELSIVDMPCHAMGEARRDVSQTQCDTTYLPTLYFMEIYSR